MLCRYCKAEGHEVKMRPAFDRYECPACDAEQIAPRLLDPPVPEVSP